MKITGVEIFVVCPPPFRGGRSWLVARRHAPQGPQPGTIRSY